MKAELIALLIIVASMAFACGYLLGLFAAVPH